MRIERAQIVCLKTLLPAGCEYQLICSSHLVRTGSREEYSYYNVV